MMKRQEDLIQNLFHQIGQLGAQNQRGTEAQPEEQIPPSPRELGGQYESQGLGLSLRDNDRLAEMVKKAMKGGLVNKDL